MSKKKKQHWLIMNDFRLGPNNVQTEVHFVFDSKKECIQWLKESGPYNEWERSHYYVLATNLGIPDELWEIEELLNG